MAGLLSIINEGQGPPSQDNEPQGLFGILAGDSPEPPSVPAPEPYEPDEYEIGRNFNPRTAQYANVPDVYQQGFNSWMLQNESDVNFWQNRMKELQPGTDEYSEAVRNFQVEERLANIRLKDKLQYNQEFQESGMTPGQFAASKRLENRKGMLNPLDAIPIASGVALGGLKLGQESIATVEELFVTPLENAFSERNNRSVLREHYGKDIKDFTDELWAYGNKYGALPPDAHVAVANGISEAVRLAPAMAIGAATRIPAVLMSVGFNSWKEGVNEGRSAGMNDSQSRNYATKRAGLEILWMMIGSRLPGGSLEEVFQRDVSKTLMSSVMNEWMEETGTELSQILLDYSMNPEAAPQSTEELTYRLRDTTIATIAAMGAANGSQLASQAITNATARNWEKAGLPNLNRKQRAKIAKESRIIHSRITAQPNAPQETEDGRQLFGTIDTGAAPEFTVDVDPSKRAPDLEPKQDPKESRREMLPDAAGLFTDTEETSVTYDTGEAFTVETGAPAATVQITREAPAPATRATTKAPGSYVETDDLYPSYPESEPFGFTMESSPEDNERVDELINRLATESDDVRQAAEPRPGDTVPRRADDGMAEAEALQQTIYDLVNYSEDPEVRALAAQLAPVSRGKTQYRNKDSYQSRMHVAAQVADRLLTRNETDRSALMEPRTLEVGGTQPIKGQGKAIRIGKERRRVGPGEQFTLDVTVNEGDPNTPNQGKFSPVVFRNPGDRQLADYEKDNPNAGPRHEYTDETNGERFAWYGPEEAKPYVMQAIRKMPRKRNFIDRRGGKKKPPEPAKRPVRADGKPHGARKLMVDPPQRRPAPLDEIQLDRLKNEPPQPTTPQQREPDLSPREQQATQAAEAVTAAEQVVRRMEEQSAESLKMVSEEKQGNETIKHAVDERGTHRHYGYTQHKSGHRTGSNLLHWSEMKRAPDLMQYKEHGIDAKTGTDNRFKGVTEFDLAAGAGILIWHDPETGIDYVVNGHHRHEIAEQTDYDGLIPVVYSDARTVAEARAHGAITNILQERGDAIDAAVFFRESGATRKDIEGKATTANKILREGEALAKLSDHLFHKVRVGQMPKQWGVSFAKWLGNDHDKQNELYNEVKKADDAELTGITNELVETMAQQMVFMPATQTKMEFMGRDSEESRTFHLKEWAQIKNGLLGYLRKKRSAFSGAKTEEKKAELESVGNEIDTETNEAMYNHYDALIKHWNDITTKKSVDPQDQELMKNAHEWKVRVAESNQTQATVNEAVESLAIQLQGIIPPPDKAASQFGEAALKADGAADLTPEEIEKREADRQSKADPNQSDLFAVSPAYQKLDAIMEMGGNQARALWEWFYGQIKPPLVGSPLWGYVSQRDQTIREHLKRAEVLSKALVGAVRREYAGKLDKNILGREYVPSDIAVTLNEALYNEEIRKRLPEDTRNIVKEMRDHIDQLSDLLLGMEWFQKMYGYTPRTKKGQPPSKIKGRRRPVLVDLETLNPNLKASIESRRGLYFTRTFFKFDDAERNARRVHNDKDLRNDFADWVLKEVDPEATQADIDAYMDWLLYKDTPNMVAKLSPQGPPKNYADPLKARKNPPDVIRRLYGEKTDIWQNYTESIGRVASFYAHQNMMVELSKDTDIFSTPGTGAKPTHTRQLASKPYLKQLRGLVTDKDTAATLEDLYTAEIPHELMQWVYWISSQVKKNVTVRSPQATNRNFWGNYPFAVANGFFEASNLVEAFNDLPLRPDSLMRRDMFGRTDKATREELIKLAKLGMMDDVTTGELRDTARIVQGSIDQLLANDISPVLTGGSKDQAEQVRAAIWNELQKGDKHADAIYQAADIVWKRNQFYRWRDLLQRAHDAANEQYTEESLDQEAADYVRRTLPNYSQLGKLTRGLARLPLVAPFVSFGAEVVRTTANRMAIINEFRSSKNPVLRAHGKRMFYGQAAMFAMPKVISKATMMLAGLTGDDEEAIRDRLPEWQKNAAIFVVPGTWDPEKGTGLVFDLDYMNPFGFTNKALQSVRANDYLGALGELMEPAAAEDLAAGVFLDIARGVDRYGRPIAPDGVDWWSRKVKQLKHVGWEVSPGAFRTAWRMHDSRTNPNRDFAPEALAVFGPRISVFDRSHADSFNFSKYKRRVEQTESEIRKLFLKENTGFNPDKIASTYRRLSAERQRRLMEFHEYLNGSVQLGNPGVFLDAAAATGGKSKILRQAYGGVPRPYLFTPNTFRKIKGKPNGQDRAALAVELQREQIQLAYEAAEERDGSN